MVFSPWSNSSFVIYTQPVSKKAEKIADILRRCEGTDSPLNPYYLAYFECFNEQQFFEAHEVLEQLWLPQRKEPNGNFYKGLIQLAGAFVHLQKNRLRPAARLFGLAKSNLTPYSPTHESLDLHYVLTMIHHWNTQLETDNYTVNPLTPTTAPNLPPPSLIIRH